MLSFVSKRTGSTFIVHCQYLSSYGFIVRLQEEGKVNNIIQFIELFQIAFVQEEWTINRISASCYMLNQSKASNNTVVPCREHFVLFYLISFLYFIYVGSNLRTAGFIFPAQQTGSLDHLSLT